MKYKGKINNINHIIVSDPTYDNFAWCRYERNNIKGYDWLVNLTINNTSDKISVVTIKGIEFYLLLQNNEKSCKLDKNDTLEYSKYIELKDYTIGMDSACVVALGINDKAKEIIDLKEEWQPYCSIKTGTDGLFGNVIEGTKDNNLCFLLISGYIDEDFINEEKLVDYLKEQFEIKDFKMEVEYEL